MAAPRVERGRLAFDGQFRGLSNRWSASLLMAPFAGAALVGLVALQAGVYNALVREDSVLESLQFIAYAAAAALAAAAKLAAVPERTSRPRHPGHELAKVSEWPETYFAVSLAVFALLAWRRVDAGK